MRQLAQVAKAKCSLGAATLRSISTLQTVGIRGSDECGIRCETRGRSVERVYLTEMVVANGYIGIAIGLHIVDDIVRLTCGSRHLDVRRRVGYHDAAGGTDQKRIGKRLSGHEPILQADRGCLCVPPST